jgi:Flp pilus assembly pilin Flp
MFDRFNLWALELVSRTATEARREEGQTFSEYALILGLVVVIAMGALTPLGGAIAGKIAQVTAALT